MGEKGVMGEKEGKKEKRSGGYRIARERVESFN
jgi:hypothetical protein